MKSVLIAFLAIAVGLLAFDEKIQRSKASEAEATLAEAQAQAGQMQTQVGALTVQIDQLKQQVATFQALKAAQVASLPAAPAAQAQAQAAAPQSMQQMQDQLVSDYSGALVVIEGKNAVGSGFLCNMDGHTYVITNAHVLADNPAFKITSVRGTVFTLGASAVAVGRDLVRIEVTGGDKAFDVMPNIDSSVKIGDMVTILGNSEGAGVVKPVMGRILGIGPDLIEVEAAFVKGNSGSPIIHQLTGKVLGVATYVTEHKVDQAAGGGVQTDIRRFGYRLDGVTGWEPINWQSFYTQSTQLTEMETLSDDFIKMFGASGNMNFDANDYSSPVLQRSIRQFLQAVRDGGRQLSAADRKGLAANFIGDLRSIAHADILAFNKNGAYDYFRREVEDQSRFRDQLYDGLSRALQNAQ